MSNSIQRDQKRRNLFFKYETKRLILKSILRESSKPVASFVGEELQSLGVANRASYEVNSIQQNQFLNITSQQKLNKIPRNSSLVRIKNRCVKTGRSKGNYRLFKISRITFRELAAKGLLPGISKASW